jgi:hypothetical protein
VTAALHHAPGRHRRIDAAGQERNQPSPGAGRQAADALLAFDVAERRSGNDLDADDEIGVIEIDLPAARGPDARPEIARQLGRRHRELRVGAAHQHAEALGRFLRRQPRHNRVGHAFEIERDARGDGIIGDAEHARQAIEDLRQRFVLPEHDLDAANHGPHLFHVQAGQRGVDVANKAADEPRAVLALERDFRIMDEHRLLCDHCAFLT